MDEAEAERNMMKGISVLAIGVGFTVLASLMGLVFVPRWQAGAPIEPKFIESEGVSGNYPRPLQATGEIAGLAEYRAQGCIYCHSQQVRAADFSADIDRGWGDRRSTPRDYLLQDPPMLGTMRTGPDLANIGARQPSDAWHHVHLYDARLVSPGSIMPPFKFLYTLTSKHPGVLGIGLPGAKEPRWIIPSSQALELVAYIRSLHQDHALEAVR